MIQDMFLLLIPPFVFAIREIRILKDDDGLTLHKAYGVDRVFLLSLKAASMLAIKLFRRILSTFTSPLILQATASLLYFLVFLNIWNNL